ncbi:TetR family transcriptional regulator [Acrocarpospora corrugata]|uniref:TetR family transcriptional regulator n=1 Tax=Acrocarpospora corrugata TaxID=35763 RepID=A0A5M3W7M9_9ACTN|nr:TetR/AcrR family transcriptional regulator [Acrocarpospora corrugata]GES04240.1 TetR family transcriptional regulator [Acrocarpospora corrugata]
MIDGRLVRGERTRQAVLGRAVALASVEGLKGMSLARLAQGLDVSKSALFSHWPDKLHLQLAVIEHARRQWIEEIVRPALREPRGVRRLWALHAYRMDFYEKRVLPGGCFFAAVEPEVDDHPGPVRDAIAAAKHDFEVLITTLIAQAAEIGELPPETDAAQLAFEIQALGAAVITHTLVLRQDPSIRFARRAVLDRLRSLATDPRVIPEASP